MLLQNVVCPSLCHQQIPSFLCIVYLKNKSIAACVWLLRLCYMCRSSAKPPFGKANRKDHRKRNRPEDDELDPMDPSSYSDAPRGGWYMIFFILVVNYASFEIDYLPVSWS